MDFIDDHKDEHGVEPICRTLQETNAAIAPSTYYAAKTRPASARAQLDAGIVPLIAKIHADNYGVYGARKIWHQLARAGHDDVARCTVERLMRINGLRGIAKTKTPRTTVPATGGFPEDWVQRDFTATAPNTLWVADIERHEALLNRAVVKGHRYRPVVAGRGS